MSQRTFALVTAIVLWMVSGLAIAATPDTASVHLTAYRVTTVQTPDGPAERLQPMKTLAPGDTVEYQAQYRNNSGAATRNVQVTLPVPAGGLQYVPVAGSADTVSASTDGVTFAAAPLVRTEVLPGGKKVQRTVPPSEYRFLRWNLGDLPAGGTRSVSARMHLPSAASTTSVR